MAPRPLLISNSDKDWIFPLDGVLDVHRKVRRIYKLLDGEDKLGLQITEGLHRDTQELRVHAFRWFNRFLKEDDSLIRVPAEPLIEPSALRVFDTLPEDERTSVIHETFVPASDPPEVPASREDWERQKASWMEALRTKVFGGWPEEGEECRLPKLVRLEEEGEASGNDEVNFYRLQLIELAELTRTPEEAHHLRRRFMLLGQTLDGMRVWDLVQQLQTRKAQTVVLRATDRAAGIALYASLFSEKVRRLVLNRLTRDHRDGPIFLNVTKYLDLPVALAFASERCLMLLTNPQGWPITHAFAADTLNMLGLSAQRLSVDLYD